MFFIALFVIESGILERICSSSIKAKKVASSYSDLRSSQDGIMGNEDSDVRLERERVNTDDIKEVTSSESIVIKNLKKYYSGFLAVDEVCVTVSKQECFGLLGQNGAGKTTTFKMLTGDVIPSSGNAWLDSYDIRHDIAMVCFFYILS